ncbi:MAG: CDP-diacylglycerol--glycerol-3-phosphate 3-phosphatidyltransferase [Devosia sp.]|jgi:cardiolipin synthase|uniref:CDP-diacylglycerol--glycerol-3-phosphate 3-phosphatidyltransferase n=1 Tax=unclassified Devosia TaxID=196773 RepID=UPI0019E74693|nr:MULTISPECIES: CDP-diacylglycerol--glycerol-3-phosphate 3-phosphatidyltransferase [unclassified Devosia]MBF0677496.1 CDP-diacylglycerol--glycerol-3-phosphate 3-phosphatidyltransferase [Devosia sp.]WEJ34442.1 CDP-diacylglycerol--glycerol-3-phosphate 3-phosphatidyltransferase [Devosia sp. SD17-2]
MARNPLTLVPNIITIARILAIIPITYLVMHGDIILRVVALVLYVLAAASDWLDGYLARAWNQYSDLGRMLDPIADKLLVGILIAALAWDGSFSGWDMIPAVAILFREFFIPGLREFLGNKTVVLPVSKLAKWKTTIQLVALAAVLAERIIPGLGLVSDVLLWAAGALTLWTGWQYLRASWPHLSGIGK